MLIFSCCSPKQIFWVEEEVYTSSTVSEDACSSNHPKSPASSDLHNDLEDLLSSQRLADIKVTIGPLDTTSQNCDKTSRYVVIKDNLRIVDCDCSSCNAPSTKQASQEFYAHKAILAGKFRIINNQIRTPGKKIQNNVRTLFNRPFRDRI